MKKKYSTIATAISAAFILAACTQTDVVDDMASMQAENPANNVVSFATYSAKKGTTRAGYLGNMTDKTLKGWEADESNGIEAFNGTGFGVFAYYTGGASDGTYNAYRGNGENNDGNTGGGVANFMYNQDVTYVSDGDYWTYDPLKYWPNDFASSAVDGGTPAAEGSGTKGNVSFFAYAPYVTAEQITANSTTGIVGMTALNAPGDPRIKYTLGANVDLLWGTLDDNSDANVLGKGNTGVGHVATGTTYEQAIIESDKDYKLAADLNKQKVDGKVKFNFIHALAAIGGNDEPDEPTDPEPGESEPTPTLQGGFMVRLALDNKNTGEASDAIDGGKRRSLGDGYQTVVTIEKITIKNTTISAKDAGITGDGQEGADGSDVTLGTLTKTAELNLATGKWERESGASGSGNSSDGDIIGQEIGTPAEGTTTDDANNVILNPKIAEYKVAGTTYFSEATLVKDYFTGASKTGNHPGVTEDNQSVYKNGSVSPLLFIPGDRPVLKINVVYVVRTYDENLNVQYSAVKNDITKIVVFPEVEMNKHYSLLMQLGLTSVKFDATVSDWEKTTPNGGNNGGQGGEGDGEGGNGNNSDADIIIDLPANVKSGSGE